MAVVMSSERRMGYLYCCLDLVLEGKIRSVHLASASQILPPPFEGDLTSKISLA